jgi:hypothetical protein
MIGAMMMSGMSPKMMPVVSSNLLGRYFCMKASFCTCFRG